MKTDSAPRYAILPDVEAPDSAGAQAASSDPADGTAAPAAPPLPEHGGTGQIAPFSPRTRAWVLAVGGFLGFLFLLRVGGILTPFLWALVVGYAFNPLIGKVCRRTGLPRVLVVSAGFVLGILVVVALLSVAIPRLSQQVTQLTDDIPTIASDLQARYFGSTSQPYTVGPFSVNVPSVARQVANSLNNALGNIAGDSFAALVMTIGRITQLLLFLIVTFYLLLDWPNICRYVSERIPHRHRDEVIDVARQVDAVLSQYMRAQLVLIALMSTAAFIVLSAMGVQFAIVLAPIAGTLEIFPIIGPFAAITLVTVVALFSPTNFGLSHTTSALVVALIFFVLRQIEDYAVIPKVVGHAVRLHPALILFAVAAGATLGGALGLFLAVPVTGALKVLGGYLYKKLDLT